MPTAYNRLIMWCGCPRPQNAESKIALEGNLGLNLLLLAALTITPPATAQRASSAGHAAAPSHSTSHSRSSHNTLALGRGAHLSGFRRSSSYPYAPGYASLPFPFFGDSFDPDDIYSTGYPVASQPPPYLLQALSQMTGPAVNNIGQAMSSPSVNESSSSEPLMIELQNGHYVRVSATVANGEALPLAPASSRTRSGRSVVSNNPATQSLPPAVLIFRDGHHEEVRDYTIADGILYARGDFYTDGYWNRQINLATLNVPETMQANAARNVKFVLPSSPNEVITRP